MTPSRLKIAAFAALALTSCTSDDSSLLPDDDAGNTGSGAISGAGGADGSAATNGAGGTGGGGAGTGGSGGSGVGGSAGTSGASATGGASGAGGNAGSSGTGATGGASGGGGSAGGGGQAGSGSGVHGTVIWTEEQIGAPLWKVGNWELFTAPLGTQADSFAAGFSTWATVWTLHAYYPSAGMIGPKTVHQPPYAAEPTINALGAGFPHGDHFPMSAWVQPAGLFFATVVVPTAGAPTGSSTDFSDGPVIPDSITLVLDGDLLLNGTVVDPNNDSTYISTAAALPGSSYTGWSHIPLNWAESTAYVAGTPGNYDFVLHIYEQASGAGWTIHVPFVIE